MNLLFDFFHGKVTDKENSCLVAALSIEIYF